MRQGRRKEVRVDPSSKKFCTVCLFNYPDLVDKASGGYYHDECYGELMVSFHKPPERLVPMNRSKVG